MKKHWLFISIFSVLFATCVSIYIHHCRLNYSKLPLVMNPFGQPLVMVEMQNKQYLLEVNLSNRCALMLRHDLLDSLDKEPLDIVQVTGEDGESIQYPSYRIKKIKIGNHVFQDVVVLELDEEKTKNTFLSTGNEKIADLDDIVFGSIGNALLSQMNLLIDIPNRIMIECKKNSQLKKMGYSLDEWIKVPCTMSRFGPVLPVKTIFGEVQLSLQTGASTSVIRSSRIGNSTQSPESLVTSFLEIGNRDFGKISLQSANLTPLFSEIDGALALDFVSLHPIYVDRQENMVYLKAPNF